MPKLLPFRILSLAFKRLPKPTYQQRKRWILNQGKFK